MAYEVEDFQKQVIERSGEVPVVVDFWASWCGPCLAFSPVIEKAAGEADGAWDLVKVDTEVKRDLSDQFRVQSLPTLMIFKDGEPVDVKEGAMLEPELHQWIDSHLHPVEPDDPRIGEIRAAVGSGDFESAASLLEEVLKDQPGNEEVKFMRLQAALAMEPTSVPGLAKEFEIGSDYYDRVQYLKELGVLIVEGGEGDFGDGLSHLQKIQLPEAAAKWIAALKVERDHEGVKKGLKNLFLYLGRDHPVTKEYQPQFASILFS
jgi:putative thioredoxin